MCVCVCVCVCVSVLALCFNLGVAFWSSALLTGHVDFRVGMSLAMRDLAHPSIGLIEASKTDSFG